MSMSARDNLLETIRGGKPERYVNQHEFYELPFCDPLCLINPSPMFPGDADVRDMWGITWSWPAGSPGPFPLHGEGLTAITDITKWKEQIQMPPLEYTDEIWTKTKEGYAKIDRTEKLAAIMFFPGLFEFCHCLMGMEEAMLALYEEPECMHELIEYQVKWEMEYITQLCTHVHPDMLIQSDDWGSSLSTFLSPAMFEEFFLEPYKKLYACCRENGIQILLHHSDTYAETLVPYMLEMGIDIWQGALTTNDIKGILERTEGRLTLMGGIENTRIDQEGISEEQIEAEVRKRCEMYGTKNYIPCMTAGGAGSAYPGVYETVTRVIDTISGEIF